MNDPDKKNFLLGVALAWAPWVPAVIGIGYAIVGISNTKATGLAAIAGGLAEMYVLVGIAATLICEVGAMVLLFRSFSREHALRNAVSVVSIIISGLMILLFGLSVWLIWLARHQTY